MTPANENALSPDSWQADGNQGEDANAGGVGTAKHSAGQTVALSQAVAMLGTEAEFLDAYARGTDGPGPGIVRAADLLHAMRGAGAGGDAMMTYCPRWDSCSAPVCPLATDWERCRHIDGERVCGLLCELVKDGGEARLRGALSGVLVQRLAEVVPKTAARWYPIRKRLGEASRTGSRMEAGQRLARYKGGAVETEVQGGGMLPDKPKGVAATVCPTPFEVF